MIRSSASASSASDGSPGAASSWLLLEHPAKAVRLLLDALALGAIDVQDLGQDRAEAGSAVLAVGREVGATVEQLPVRREERRERPAALPGDGLHRPLVPGVDVRAFIPVHLDADEVLVQELGQARVLVGLPIHHVTPVAPHGADVEQNRPILRRGAGEGLRLPAEPVNRLLRGGSEVRGSCRHEAITHAPR